MSSQYDKALAFAREKHQGQYRKGGLEYITHPIAVAQIVANKGLGLAFQITALFHDLLEDTDASEEEILALGGPEVLEAVKRLTKYKGYDMATYINDIKANEIAFEVKAADRLHNLQSAICTDVEFKRKYILETLDWYLDFSYDIKEAVKALVDSLEEPLSELSFLYEPIDSWKM